MLPNLAQAQAHKKLSKASHIKGRKLQKLFEYAAIFACLPLAHVFFIQPPKALWPSGMELLGKVHRVTKAKAIPLLGK
jgi:hypothetical protein